MILNNLFYLYTVLLTNQEFCNLDEFRANIIKNLIRPKSKTVWKAFPLPIDHFREQGEKKLEGEVRSVQKMN